MQYISLPQPFIKDFVRGYFDGDGCVFLYRSRGLTQKVILRKLSVIFTSGSRKFLEDLLAVLKKNMKLRQEKIYDSTRSFQLRFTTKDTVEIFKFIYSGAGKSSFFERKYIIFANYFAARPSRVDAKVESILQCLGRGHVVK